MGIGNVIFVAFGRMLISIIFILLGVATIFNWDVAEREFSGTLANWEIYGSHLDKIVLLFGYLGEVSTIVLAIGVILQIVGGLSLFFGYRVRVGAILLLIYLISANIIYHHFWFLQGEALARSLILFLKNLSIIGALIIVIAIGSGRSNISRVQSKCRPQLDED